MLPKLPSEIQEAIVVECATIRPSAIASLAQTCASLRQLIANPPDNHLWRSIFLAVFDDPRPALSVLHGKVLDSNSAAFDWQSEAQRRFRASIRMDRAAMAEMAEFSHIVDEAAIDALVDTVYLALPAGSGSPSLNESWIENCMRAAMFPKVNTQHIAKLHILASFMRVRTSASLPAMASLTASCRLRSRAYTYDMRNYKPETWWGPWMPNGRGEVNWEHLWHLINVVRHNAVQRGNSDIPLLGFDGLRAYSVPKPLEDPEIKMNDWAGVQGVWMRAVSFMDYRDLHEYNYHHINEDGSLPTRIFEHHSFDEAFRLIKGHFSVVHVEERGPPKYPHRPTIHFVGDASLSSYPHDAIVHRITKGTVSVTEAGEIRWSFVTAVGGHRWASEGVQIGGVQSRAGVVGVWSSADHEEGDPAGPFWLWRSDESKQALKRARSPHLHYQLVVNLAT